MENNLTIYIYSFNFRLIFIIKFSYLEYYILLLHIISNNIKFINTNFFDILITVIIMFNIDEAVVNLGKRIQEARLLRNITQEQIAEQCNVTPKHISAIERGTSPGSVVLLLNICNILDITPNTLFIDAFNKDNEAKDNIIPIEKHSIILKYSKLTESNKNFVDSAIKHLYNEQTRKN